jgi:hypothetical protein
VRRFVTRLCDRWRAPQRLPIYEFEEVTDLMHGWQTHVARQLAIHEQSARRTQGWHHWLGGLAVVFASLAGSSAVVAWQTQTSNSLLAFASAAVAGGAAVLTGIVTFLDLGGRAEQHRKAAADYKNALRGLEAIPFKPPRPDPPPKREPDLREIEQLQTALRDIDASAPIPPRGIAERVIRMGVDPHPYVFPSRHAATSTELTSPPGSGTG